MSTDVQQLNPNGTNGVSGVRMADLGARAGALGLERGAVHKMVARMETAAREAALDNTEALVDDFMAVLGARLNRLLQDVRALPEQATQGMLDKILANPMRGSLVSRDSVLQIITAAMLEKPTR